jgi:hypothetical protein
MTILVVAALLRKDDCYSIVYSSSSKQHTLVNMLSTSAEGTLRLG